MFDKEKYFIKELLIDLGAYRVDSNEDHLVLDVGKYKIDMDMNKMADGIWNNLVFKVPHELVEKYKNTPRFTSFYLRYEDE